MRPKQAMRYKLMEMRQSIDLPLPCTTMHVRRGDAGFPRPPYRRYAAVQEYLDAASVAEGDNIMLLTDDQSTIDEIKKYHRNYNWTYLERPRNRGIDGGWESHVPSGDGAYEILSIYTEVALASQCSKVVHGQSGFMKVLRGKMEMAGRKYKAFIIDTGVSKANAKKWPSDGKARIDYFEKQMADYRAKSDAKKKEKDSSNKKGAPQIGRGNVSHENYGKGFKEIGLSKE